MKKKWTIPLIESLEIAKTAGGTFPVQPADGPDWQDDDGNWWRPGADTSQ